MPAENLGSRTCLAGAAAAEHAAFLVELLAAELELRRAHGRSPSSGRIPRAVPRSRQPHQGALPRPAGAGAVGVADDATAEGPGDDSALMGLVAYRLGLVGRERTRRVRG